jgi:uncharacterized membrane protein YgcG
VSPSWLIVSIALASASQQARSPLTVQFGEAATGLNVTICLDGSKVETTFAGKLSFRDATHSWQSVCADVRSPVSSGQYFDVNLVNTQKAGGRIARAGNIVARWFPYAQTREQCAALQIAVWKELEDGTDIPDFGNGRFTVTTEPMVMMLAAQYYSAAQTPGEALFLQVNNGGGQGAGGAGQGSGGGQGGGGGQSQLTTP